MKRIAIPCEGQRVSAHFGHAPQFMFIDVDDQGQIVKSETLDAPPHEPGLLPRWIAEQKATAVLAGGMGGRARELFAQHGIEVVVGAPADDPQTAATAYAQGQLRTSDNTCDHGRHGCGE